MVNVSARPAAGLLVFNEHSCPACLVARPRPYFCCRSGVSVPQASTDTSLVARDMAV